VRGEGRLYIRVFPHKSVTSIPAETRMGKGKGEPEFWAAVIKPGMILFEISGLPDARQIEAHQDAIPAASWDRQGGTAIVGGINCSTEPKLQAG
jgi:ribosomal protein L16